MPRKAPPARHLAKRLRRWIDFHPEATCDEFSAYLARSVGSATAGNLLDRLEAFVQDAMYFDVLAHSSFLEGTLILPSGTRVVFEWDKDDPSQPTLRALMAALLKPPATPEKDHA